MRTICGDDRADWGSGGTVTERPDCSGLLCEIAAADAAADNAAADTAPPAANAEAGTRWFKVFACRILCRRKTFSHAARRSIAAWWLRMARFRARSRSFCVGRGGGVTGPDVGDGIGGCCCCEGDGGGIGGSGGAGGSGGGGRPAVVSNGGSGGDAGGCPSGRGGVGAAPSR